MTTEVKHLTERDSLLDVDWEPTFRFFIQNVLQGDLSTGLTELTTANFRQTLLQNLWQPTLFLRFAPTTSTSPKLYIFNGLQETLEYQGWIIGTSDELQAFQ
ncbi:hypothetical protein M422DRAFT_261157 [Sphaerobolus stellatus SS14]|uniref:Uncharacterized protein n=1 Tax=Sphaerobolus stellatus (strain SS14) TaxID=990650 RepID=A0A0C9VGG1_SPHS4|nr:hypothetical protein M422DRAFT_261153 [Sphaerobolus stellatus SS14]KIJ36416.1 hypothetical protein M422DRAFT_261157 [Sphaerobolus stellatus SS14]